MQKSITNNNNVYCMYLHHKYKTLARLRVSEIKTRLMRKKKKKSKVGTRIKPTIHHNITATQKWIHVQVQIKL